MNEHLEELRTFLKDKGFEEEYIAWAECYEFTNANLKIYFRRKYNKWKLKDTTMNSELDIGEINFPINEDEAAKLWRWFSFYYKGN